MTLLKAVDGLSKKQIKTFEKFSHTYLLDKIEINTKSRCVLAWSGDIQVFAFPSFTINGLMKDNSSCLCTQILPIVGSNRWPTITACLWMS